MERSGLAHYLLDPSTIRQVENLSFLIGFDGFTDDIVRLVKRRDGAHHYEIMSRMAEFSERIRAASGKSTNFELVPIERRLGGNGPIMAQSLLHSNARVSIIGALGYPRIEPLFESLATSCRECISIAPSGHTDAIEFSDGKLLLGKHESILAIDEKLIKDLIGPKKLIHLFENCSLFASVNWTMILSMTALWKYFSREIFPACKKLPAWMFVDLADPAKRSDSDLLDALKTLKELQKTLKIVLGLNVAEAERVARVMHTHADAASLHQVLEIEQVVIHAIESAEASNKEGSAKVHGPHVEKPLITTGGGDNFNAGYCLSLALGLSLMDALSIATYTSGYYVRHAKSPTLLQLAHFLQS